MSAPEEIVLPDDPSLLDPEKFNILIPSPDMARNLPPGVRFRMVAVRVDPEPPPAGKDVWKSGGGYSGKGEAKRWMDQYELTEKALARIRRAAGIDSSTELVMADGNTRIYKGTVTQRGPDGRPQSKSDDYEMAVDARVEEFRAMMEDGFRSSGFVKAKTWDPKARNGEGKYVDIQLKGDEARLEIERKVRDQSIHLRKFATSIASTRCQTKALRHFLALRGNYTQSDLCKPFVVYFYEFQPGREESPRDVQQHEQQPGPAVAERTTTNAHEAPAPPATPPPAERPKMEPPTGKPDFVRMGKPQVGAPGRVGSAPRPVPSQSALGTQPAGVGTTTPDLGHAATLEDMFGSGKPAVQAEAERKAAMPPATPGKPSIKTRVGMIGDLSLEEVRELGRDIMLADGKPPTSALGVLPRAELTDLVLTLHATMRSE